MSNFAGGQSFDSSSASGKSSVGSSGYLSSRSLRANSFDVSLSSYPKNNDSIASASSETAAFRVMFDSGADPYSLYERLRCFVVDGDGRKFFVGVFDAADGKTYPVIQVALTGQTIQSLADTIQRTAGVTAQVLPGWGLVSVGSLLESDHINATDIWAYFFVEKGTVQNPPESELPSNLRLYFTSVEPVIEQGSPSQSVGGFVSPTEVMVSSSLEFSVSFYDQSIQFVDSGLSSFDVVQINDEIVEIDRWEGLTAFVKTRQAYDTPIRFHPKGSLARGITKNAIFDLRMSKDKKQFRCLALRNTSDTETAYDVKVFFKLASRNSFSSTRICLEIPRTERVFGSAKSGTRTAFDAKEFANLYGNNDFVGTSLTFETGDNQGQTRLVASYDGAAGGFVLDEDLPYAVKDEDRFVVDTFPSQRVKSGFEGPVTGSDALSQGRLVTELQNATFYQNGVSIDVNGERAGGADLRPQEVVYIWIEREINDINELFINNRCVLTAGYSRV